MVSERFGGNQRAGLILGILLVVALFVAASWWLLTPSREALFAQPLSEENQAEVLAHLMQWGTSFEQEEGTGAILVDSEQVSTLRSKLGAIGIPSREHTGLELFDKGDYGMSEFAQRINYQRALEGELARSIRAFDEVRFARVHLTLAKNSLFENRKEAAKASVVIQLKPNKHISDEQVSGIQQLISGAVPGLSAEQVAVIDEAGRALGGAQDLAPKRQAQKVSAVEQEYEIKALHLLAGLFPDEQIYVSVRASVNHDRVRSVREEIIPAHGGNVGYVVKRRDQVTAVGSQNEQSRNSAPSSNGSEVEYAYSKERSEIEKAPGAIKQLSVGVVITGAASPEQIEGAKNALRSGLGLNEGQGDQLAIVTAKPAIQNDPIRPIGDDMVVATEQADPLPAERQADEPGNMLAFLLPVLAIVMALVWWLRTRRHAVAVSTPPKLTLEERERLLRDIRQWIGNEGASA